MTRLAGKAILVVEDEAVIAITLEDMLDDLGCRIVGPAMHLGHALELAQSAEIDAAILDVNLNGERSFPVADALEARGVPFLFATGYAQESVGWAGHPVQQLAKPYRSAQIEEALLRIFGRE